MTERPGHCPEFTMFDLLRALNYVDSQKCDLDVFLFPQSKKRGSLSPILITRISTKLSVAQSVGFFDISFDSVRPVFDTTYIDARSEEVIIQTPFPPFYRIRETRHNGNDPKFHVIDETFEPSAMAIHNRLFTEIVERKKAQGKEAYDEITRMLQQHQV